MKITRDAVWHTTKDYSIITLGLIFYAVGFCGFILPHGVITGGLAGIAALIFSRRVSRWHIRSILSTSYSSRLPIVSWGAALCLKPSTARRDSASSCSSHRCFSSHIRFILSTTSCSLHYRSRAVRCGNRTGIHPQRQHRRHRHRGCDGVEIPSDFRRAYDSLC